MEGSADEADPHRDPVQFDRVVDEAGPDTLLVVIERSMGPAVRAVCEAEDVWQETLAAAWKDRAQHSWTDARAYRAWLITIARNRIRMIAREAAAEKRGGGRRPARFSDLGGSGTSSLSDMLPSGSVTPSRIASARERSRAVRDALESLPGEDQKLVQGHLLEGRPMEEVAAELGLHLSAAWRRLRKAVAAYTRQLAALRSGSIPGPAGPAA